MKHLTKIILIFLVANATVSHGQTISRKNNISIGFGKQAYNGDLGNAWFKTDEEWYGFISLQYNRYFSKSFDFGGLITHGDFGHCQEPGSNPFNSDGTMILMMRSRLTSIGVSAKFKLANGYFLSENAKLAPYIYGGVGINNLVDIWSANKDRVNQGNYASFNGGFGIRFNFNEKYNFTYNLGFGYLANDNIDYKTVGKNDMFMQHSLMLGINF